MSGPASWLMVTVGGGLYLLLGVEMAAMLHEREEGTGPRFAVLMLGWLCAAFALGCGLGGLT